MSRTLRVAHLPILSNPYGSHASNDLNCKVSARVSPEDHAFLKRAFPFLPNVYDIVLSRLYHNFIADLRTTIPAGTDPAYLGPSDPLYLTLADVLARCTPRGSVTVERHDAGARVESGEPSELSEALRVLEAVGTDSEGGNAGQRNESAEEEKGQRDVSNGTVEGVVGVDPELSNLFNLLKS